MSLHTCDVSSHVELLIGLEATEAEEGPGAELHDARLLQHGQVEGWAKRLRSPRGGSGRTRGRGGAARPRCGRGGCFSFKARSHQAVSDVQTDLACIITIKS